MTTSELIDYYTEESDQAFGFIMRSSYSDPELLGFDSLGKMPNGDTPLRKKDDATVKLLQ